MLPAGLPEMQRGLVAAPACAAPEHPPRGRRQASCNPITIASPTIESVISPHGLAMLHANYKGGFMARPMFCRASAIAMLAVLSTLSGWTVAAAQDVKLPDYEAIGASPDRSDADRQTDQRRQPAKILAFTDVRSGIEVLDMEA